MEAMALFVIQTKVTVTLMFHLASFRCDSTFVKIVAIAWTIFCNCCTGCRRERERESSGTLFRNTKHIQIWNQLLHVPYWKSHTHIHAHTQWKTFTSTAETLAQAGHTHHVKESHLRALLIYEIIYANVFQKVTFHSLHWPAWPDSRTENLIFRLWQK